MKYLFFILVLSLYVCVLTGVMFLVLPSYGEVWGLLLGMLTILFSFLFGDKLLLSYLQIKKVNHNSMLNRIFQNFCYQQRLRGVNIYTSSVNVNNILVIDGLFSKSINIIVGEKITDLLTLNELKSILFSCLDEVNSRDSKFNLLFVELLLIIYSPLIFLENFLSTKIAFLSKILSFIIYPFIAMAHFSFQKTSSLRRGILFENLTEIKEDEFQSALLKLELAGDHNLDVNIINNFLSFISIAKNCQVSIFDYIFREPSGNR